MKKGLSVLLIAAALFGFYGGATSLTDILASKDYWEEQGEKSTADMNKLEDGLNQLKDNEKAYLDGQKTLADGEKKLADAEVQLEEGRATLAQGYADYAAAPAKLRAGEAALAAGEKDYAEGEQTLSEGKATLKQLKEGVAELNEKYPTWRHGNDVVHGRSIKTAQEQGLYGVANDPNGAVTGMGSMFTSGSLDSSKISKALSAVLAKAVYVCNTSAGEGLPGMITVYIGVVTQKLVPSVTQAYCEAHHKTIEELTDKDKENIQNEAQNQATNYVKSDLGTLTADEENVQGILDKLVKAGLDGETGAKGALSKASSAITAYSTLAQLAAGKVEIQNKLLPLVDKLVKNDAAVEKLGGRTAVNQLVAGLKGNDDQFMTSMDAIMDKAPGLIAMTAQAVHKGENDLAAGAAKLAAGRRELAQGYADYAAAPAKLADGEKQLADGEKQYADGKKQLEDGKKKLAEYEDGEQQVRDGLATLMATKADPGLESILDRSNGDDKFDDANGHLQLDKGLAAVDTGRGYQADSGELITKEITNRAVGTAAGLGAAALAVLAAILSFLKKSKGAAVSAVLAAVAGGIGAGVGLSAGEYYSDIAGSTIGNTPFIAAAVLAAVAAVFAIVHFTAKPEAK